MENKFRIGGVTFLPLAIILGFSASHQFILQLIDDPWQMLVKEQKQLMRKCSGSYAKIMLVLQKCFFRLPQLINAKSLQMQLTQRKSTNFRFLAVVAFLICSPNNYFGGLDKYNLDQGRYQASLYITVRLQGVISGTVYGIKALMIMYRLYYVPFRWMEDQAFSGRN